MKNTSDEKILEEANLWINANHKVALATVIKTWGSSPRQVGSKMIVNEKGEFSGSISGGCVESSVIDESLQLIKESWNKFLEEELTKQELSLAKAKLTGNFAHNSQTISQRAERKAQLYGYRMEEDYDNKCIDRLKSISSKQR